MRVQGEKENGKQDRITFTDVEKEIWNIYFITVVYDVKLIAMISLQRNHRYVIRHLKLPRQNVEY